MPQRLAPVSGAPSKLGSLSEPLPAVHIFRRGAGIGLLLLLAPILTSRLRAQERGSLQVAAQVISTAPSQLALAAGLAGAKLGTAPVAQSLASVQVTTSPWPEPAPSAEPKQAQTLVTISFLRN